ncbi:MAG: CcmD family protein [Gemmatimonadetes bacterium]|nr:CcmD family protein [Gemmatimonadota bacterium]MDA1104207.1 CcmD family protein [Gemmatimonadota bacterium]
MILFRNRVWVARTVLACALFLLATAAVGAQEIQGLPRPTALASQSLRPYWHVFAAYAIVITLIGGWAISIGRRLRDLEDRLR